MSASYDPAEEAGESTSGSRSGAVIGRIRQEGKMRMMRGRFELRVGPKMSARKGGQGQVIRIIDSMDGAKECAAKFPVDDFASTHEGLVREATLWAAQAQHEHVADILYVGYEGGGPVLVLPWADWNLKEYVAHLLSAPAPADAPSPKPADVCVPIDWALQMAFGLQFLHTIGVIHGDVKPSNVLVYPDSSPTGVTLKLCDLGLSLRVVNRTPDGVGLGEKRSCRGTPGQRAPEQKCNEQPLTDRCDVWGWAVCLLLCLHGDLPKKWPSRRCPEGEERIRCADKWAERCVMSVRDDCWSEEMPQLGACVSAELNHDGAGLEVHRSLLQLVQSGLQRDPLQRPPVLKCIETLRGCHKTLCGEPYVRDMPASHELSLSERKRRELMIEEQMRLPPDQEKIAAIRDEYERACVEEWFQERIMSALESPNRVRIESESSLGQLESVPLADEPSPLTPAKPSLPCQQSYASMTTPRHIGACDASSRSVRSGGVYKRARFSV